jgi:hypothetical protein
MKETKEQWDVLRAVLAYWLIGTRGYPEQGVSNLAHGFVPGLIKAYKSMSTIILVGVNTMASSAYFDRLSISLLP